MARTRSLALCGLDRAEEEAIRSFFDAAVRQGSIPWVLANESEADALLIDVDSMYGQMSWLRAQGGARPIVALTSASRADADFLLARPATQQSLAGVLGMLSERVAAPAAPATETAKPAPVQSSIPTPPAPTPVVAVAAPTATPAPAAVVEPEPEPEPLPPGDLQLVDFLRDGLLPGPVSLRGAEPTLLIDPLGKTWLGGGSLKPLLPLAARTIKPDDWEALTSHDYEHQAGSLGAPQPLSRLLWLAGLGAGGGQLLPELSSATRFKLGKYPTTEREFPKHIRIATAMLKQLSTPEELATASGLERGDVVDFINACHALGLVETDIPSAPADTAEVAKGGLLGRLRGKR